MNTNYVKPTSTLAAGSAAISVLLAAALVSGQAPPQQPINTQQPQQPINTQQQPQQPINTQQPQQPINTQQPQQPINTQQQPQQPINTAPSPTGAPSVGTTVSNVDPSGSVLGIQGLGVTMQADIRGRIMVTGVSQQGILTGLGLRVGDQITAVNGQSVRTVADALKRLINVANQGQASGGSPSASLTISRNGSQQVLNVPSSNLASLLQAQGLATGAPATDANATADATANTDNSATAAATNNATPNPNTQATSPPTFPNPNNTLPDGSLARRPLETQQGTAGNRPNATAPTTTATAPDNSGTATTLPDGSLARRPLESQQGAGAGTSTAAATAPATDNATVTDNTAAGTAPVFPNDGTRLPDGSLARRPLESQQGANATGTTTTTIPPTDTATTTDAATTGGTASTTNSANNQTFPEPGTRLPDGSLPRQGAAPAAGATQPNSAANQLPLPTTVITPNGPRIVLPQGGAAGARGNAGAGATPNIGTPNNGVVPRTGAPAGPAAQRGGAGGARPAAPRGGGARGGGARGGGGGAKGGGGGGAAAPAASGS